MINWVNDIRKYIEPKAFGVCAQLGKKMGIASSHVRLFFIYTTFVANWSPIIIYMILAFWMNMRQYMEEKKNRIWDL